MPLASGSGLPQARDALVQMDNYVPAAQRSQAQSLARQLEADAKSQRSAELAAAELNAPPVSPKPIPAVVSQPVSHPATKPPVVVAAATPPPAKPPVAARQGKWRIQLGAFGVAGNAERLWSQLSGNPALAGTRKTLLPSGKVTRLLATGFASEAEASNACSLLKRQGQACVVAGQG
jgi:uncharacterized protein